MREHEKLEGLKNQDTDLDSWLPFPNSSNYDEDTPAFFKNELASLDEFYENEEAIEIAQSNEDYLKSKDEVFAPEEEAWKEGFELGLDEGEFKTKLKILYLLLEDEKTKKLEPSSLARLTSLSEDDVLEAKGHLS